MILSFLPLIFMLEKNIKLGDLVCNDDDYDDENLVFTWVGSWVQAMEMVVFIGGGMHASSHALTDRHSNIGRVIGTLGVCSLG